jgi:hypothetical protein
LGLQPAAPAVSSGSSSVRAGSRRGELHDRAAGAAATDAIHRAAPRAVALPDQFTFRSGESCSTMHPTSRGGCLDHPHTAKVATFVLRLRLGGIVFALDDIPVPVWTARGVRWHERSCRRACARCHRRRRRAKEWVAEGSPCTPSRRLRGRAADAAEREPLQCAQTRLLRPSIGHRGRDRQGWA